MNIIIEQAATAASLAHDGQVRKFTNEPYFVHCEAVAMMVMTTGLDQEVVAAAYMHDMIEDCNVRPTWIGEHFGERVMRLDVSMTDMPASPGFNRAARKKLTRDRFQLLQGQDCIDAHTIKVCDLHHNISSIREFDPNFYKLYREEAIDLLRVLCHADQKIKDRLCDELETPRIQNARGPRVKK